ncbi:sulfite exporter TauE/SafE family protein [Shumkonia mesophila]|uniref:sulfite exporter TauE/SafE family protein n=1 Tax=Shumkonia mesophila TaxID=2838854 RepID=UPI00293452FB|nr:sulfite exporter TauE/SafE family protein [Shumkonia mesophila]
MNAAIAAGAILAVSAVFVVLGLGGGILFVPILHWAGFDLGTAAIPLGLMLNGLNTLLALIPYGRAGLVDWKGGLPMAAAAAITAPLGALAQPHLASGTVLALFAGAVTLAAMRAVRGAAKKPALGSPAATPAPHPRRLVFRLGVGAGVGFVGGLLGIGAGFVVAPALMALGYPPRQTAATTALVVTVCSFTGAAGYAGTMELPGLLTALAAVAVIVGSQIGSRLMIKGAKPAWITWGYAAILTAVAVKLLWEAAASSLG